MKDTCRGPGLKGPASNCKRPVLARGYCRPHYLAFLSGRSLGPVRSYGKASKPGPTLRLLTTELRQLARMAKKHRVSVYEMARRIVRAGLK